MSYIPANVADKTATGTITTLGNTVATAVTGYKSCGIVVSGTWTGTLAWELSSDNQATWGTSSVRGMSIVGAGGGNAFPSMFTSIIANGNYKTNSMGGITHVRLRASSVITGTVNVSIVLTDSPHLFTFTSSEIVQNVVGSQYNDSTANLAGGVSFTGNGETTLGVAGIQVNFISDQVCRIQVQQSMDNDPSHWDISDEFSSNPGIGDSRTFQATASYFRVIVTNVTGTITTYLRLQTALCPIVEVLPRSLSQEGNLQVSVEEAASLSRDYFINTQFSNSYLDEYNWYRNSGSGGAVTPSTSYLAITTSTNSASNAQLDSKKIIVPSIHPVLVLDAELSLDAVTGLNNNTRRWGLLSAGETDGVCFELMNGVMYATTMSNSIPSRVSIDGFKPAAGEILHYSIDVSRISIEWRIGDVLVYRIFGASAVFPVFANRNFRIAASNVNSGAVGSTAYIRISYLSLYTSVVGAVRLQGDDGLQTNVSIDGYLRQKGYGSIIFSELFPDNTLDTTNKWTEAIVTGGSKSLASSLLTLSVTTANGASITETAKQSVLTAAGQSMTRIMMVCNLGLVFDNNNVREWGTKTGNNGFFFRQVGQSTYAVRVNGGSETTLALPAITDGRIHIYEIVRTGLTDAWFYVDRERVGAMHGTTSGLVGSKYDTAYLANYNTGISANPISLVVSAHVVIEDSSQTVGIIGTDPNGLKKQVAVNENGALRITQSGVIYPTTTEAGEAVQLREYTFAFEYNTVTSGTEYPLFYIRNPLGSGKRMFIREIRSGNVTSGRVCLTRVYHTPTVTANGTAQTPVSMNIGGGAPAASVLVNTVPTVTGNGTRVSEIASNDQPGVLDYNWGLILNANFSLLITVQGNSNNTVVALNIIWTETN